VTNVAGRTLAVMAERFGCDPADVQVGVGPSLGPCCAEFVNYREEIPRELWGYRRNSAYFDFWAMSRDQLSRAGVPQDQIHISGLCTKCRTDSFFSYRAEKTTGRFPAVIGLR
jgi:copper oxidase (laccase) domain-containing protein